MFCFNTNVVSKDPRVLCPDGEAFMKEFREWAESHGLCILGYRTTGERICLHNESKVMLKLLEKEIMELPNFKYKITIDRYEIPEEK